MTEPITLRTAHPDDAEVIFRQRCAMFEDIWGPTAPEAIETMKTTFLPWVRRGLAKGAYRGWLACLAEGTAVAGGGLIVHQWMAHPLNLDTRRAYIANIYTEPPYRRQGLARRIVRAILDHCSAEGLQIVSLHASPVGQSLYASLGFQPTNEMRLELRR